jgi:RNA polymerase sigma-70 factor (ECF subfamily)
MNIAREATADRNSCVEREPTPAQLKQLSDEELVAYLKAGHTDPLAILFDRYHRLVLSIARKILRDSGEAEDLMQAVFCEIFQAAAQFDPSRGSTKGWILRFAYSRSLNRKRYLRTRSFYAGREPDHFDTLELEPGQSATAGLSEAEGRVLVRQGLATLSARQRKALELAFFEGLSMAEIAERQNEPVTNIRHHYYRGLQKLRALLYPESCSQNSGKAVGRNAHVCA